MILKYHFMINGVEKHDTTTGTLVSVKMTLVVDIFHSNFWQNYICNKDRISKDVRRWNMNFKVNVLIGFIHIKLFP